MSTDVSLKMLTDSRFGSGNGRDARGKKTLRKLMDESLPRELQVGVEVTFCEFHAKKWDFSDLWWRQTYWNHYKSQMGRHFWHLKLII